MMLKQRGCFRNQSHVPAKRTMPGTEGCLVTTAKKMIGLVHLQYELVRAVLFVLSTALATQRNSIWSA